jgi:hypothetical protein
MNEKKFPGQDDRLAAALAAILDLDLLPDTVAEAETLLRREKINVDNLRRRAAASLREISGEFSDDWRNAGANSMEATVSELETRPLQLELSAQQLRDRIQALFESIGARHGSQSPMPSLGWRNLEEQSKEDLARLLRKVEYVAEELGIEPPKD